jgi:hypothetical protein
MLRLTGPRSHGVMVARHVRLSHVGSDLEQVRRVCPALLEPRREKKRRLRLWLFLITHQFSLRVPNLQAVPVDYVMIWTQGFRGFERQF